MKWEQLIVDRSSSSSWFPWSLFETEICVFGRPERYTRALNTKRKACSWWISMRFLGSSNRTYTTNKKSPFRPVDSACSGRWLDVSLLICIRRGTSEFVGLDGDCKADVLLPTGHGVMFHFQRNWKIKQIGRRDDKKSLTKYPVQLSKKSSTELFRLFDLEYKVLSPP